MRVNTQVAPTARLLPNMVGKPPGPPTRAVLPSAVSAADWPRYRANAGSLPTSLLPCWVHWPLARVNTHTAPDVLLSPLPPSTAVLPSEDKATDMPWCAWPTPLPTSLKGTRLHTPTLRVNTHAAPVLLLSKSPPISAVFPSEERAIEMP